MLKFFRGIDLLIVNDDILQLSKDDLTCPHRVRSHQLRGSREEPIWKIVVSLLRGRDLPLCDAVDKEENSYFFRDAAKGRSLQKIGNDRRDRVDFIGSCRVKEGLDRGYWWSDEFIAGNSFESEPSLTLEKANENRIDWTSRREQVQGQLPRMKRRLVEKRVGRLRQCAALRRRRFRREIGRGMIIGWGLLGDLQSFYYRLRTI
ncbi:hypothetical protein HYFRA_00006518 [Hymenoscyphus fraxineus]|uniref:Uncharacterized protein n=1 Tax=Hymenoscyphus fraxineus TaxID=746836 RepID=A0A9N9KS39_9HELO|nr:hypothetical protein HYFRA_00006518 [Hymenoscyphus fraxineus]